MTEAEDKIIGTVFAGCKIICKLGQGGMGTVYKAHQESLDKFVCVKLLSPDLAREQRNIDFFLREARSAAKLDHPNIVHVYNFGQENGAYFIVMSYVEGKSLQDVVAEKGPLPIKEATDIIIGVLDGLAHAHSKSIIHRDIKPSNILISPDGLPHIVDFGLARSINEEKQLTMAGEMIGTAYFMSPEQGLAGQVDSRADLYSAGATYFYILTGRYPFEGKSSIEVIHKHISDPVPNVMLIRPDIPLWASRIIDNLMRKKPEERYQSAAEVVTALQKYSSGEEVMGVPLEKTFDMPDVTARMGAGAPPPAPAASLDRANPKLSDRSRASAPPPPPSITPRERPQFQARGEAPQKPELQLTGLHNGIRIATHLALTLAATGCFILAGASGKVPGSLWSPLDSNPVVAGILAFAGLVLFGFALWKKPYKFTPLYSLFVLAAAAAAYAGGAFIPAPAGADTVSKAFLALQIGLENMFSGANVIVYALFLYLAASKAVFKENWGLKIFAVAAYLGGLGLTYLYFKAGAEITPDRIWLTAGGGLALLGLAAALTQKGFSLFFNPQLFFLAANVMMFTMFTNPQIQALTEAKVKADAAAVQQINYTNRAKFQQALLLAQSEALYDEEGRPIEAKKPPLPEEVKPADRDKLQNQARLDYYKALTLRVTGALAGSAGIIFIAFFLSLMANACFLEELLAVYRERDLL